MGKRNQYNRSTLPNDMNIILYNAAAALSGPSADFTVNADSGIAAIRPSAGTYTGSIDVASMKNGQRLDIIIPGDGFLLSCSAGGGKLLSSNGFVNTSSLSAGKTYVCYKLDSIDLGEGPTSNVLVLAFTGSYIGF
jgi:hypothetical protein